MHLLGSTATFVLVHLAHGRTAQDREQSKSVGTRMLNIHGRWSAHPSVESPVLAWRERAEAERAAAVAAAGRGAHVGVEVLGGNRFELGRDLVAFEPAHESALRGYIPLDALAASKREASRVKVLAAAAYLLGKHLAREDLVEHSKTLAANPGVGASDFLLGKTGRAIADAILDGELQADAQVSPVHLAQALAIARAQLEMRRAPGVTTGGKR